MDWFDNWALTLAVFIPIVGMVILLVIPKAEENLIKVVALLTTLLTGAVGIGILAGFNLDSGRLQFQANESWIPVIHSRYHVGIDGISLPLVLLTMLVTVCCIIYSWNHFPEPHNPKAFLALILLLETGMIGTFVAQDLILFFIFFEVVLLPMFFMIGVWGGPNREYASIKFFLFTLFGSALMLLSFLALFFLSKVCTFERKKSARKLNSMRAEPNSVNRKNLIDAYSRLGPPQTPIMKNIGSRTISKKMKKRMRSWATNVPFIPTAKRRMSARNAFGLCGSGKWFHE